MIEAAGLEQHKKNRKDILKPEGYKISLYSLLLSTLAINIFSLALPVMTLQVYDRILPNPGTGTLPVLVAGVCLAIVLEAVLRLCRAYLIGRSSASYEHRIACKAMNRILNADLNKIGSYGIGEHLHRMSSVGKLKDFYNGYSATVLIELAFVPLFFALIAYIGGIIVAVPAAILVLFTIVSIWKGYGLRAALHRREAVDDKRFNFLIESLEGVHTVKSFALEKFFSRRYEAMEENSSFANFKVTEATAATFNASAIFSNIMVAAVISVGAYFVLGGALTTGGLIAILLLSGRIMQPVQRALSLWAQYQDFRLARRHIEDLLMTAQHEITPRTSDGQALPEGRLSMSNVTFRYRNEDSPILQGIDLEFQRGEAISISGTHGAGKTTLLNLIAGIYAAQDGEILLDGEKISAYRAEELVRHVGYIRSIPLIFRGTIRDNITCFGQTPEAQAKELAALVQVDKDVAKLPGGFDTFLTGTNTDSITPGLKQRLAIVRVLANKPRLILFDGADRALDKEGYATIYSLLARLKSKTSMILVSDDRNIYGLAERHYELLDGKLRRKSVSANSNNVRPYKELRL